MGTRLLLNCSAALAEGIAGVAIDLAGKLSAVGDIAGLFLLFGAFNSPNS